MCWKYPIFTMNCDFRFGRSCSFPVFKLTFTLLINCLFFFSFFFLLFFVPLLYSGLVDALRCLQWVLWLACLSVLDSLSLDSVGQELISRERHEHSHPSRGGHCRHLIPGHGCWLRVSNTRPLLCTFLCPLTSSYSLLCTIFRCVVSPKCHSQFCSPFFHLTPLLCVVYSFIWARLSPSPFQGPQHALCNNWSCCFKKKKKIIK